MRGFLGALRVELDRRCLQPSTPDQPNYWGLVVPAVAIGVGWWLMPLPLLVSLHVLYVAMVGIYLGCGAVPKTRWIGSVSAFEAVAAAFMATCLPLTGELALAGCLGISLVWTHGCQIGDVQRFLALEGVLAIEGCALGMLWAARTRSARTAWSRAVVSGVALAISASILLAFFNNLVPPDRPEVWVATAEFIVASLLTLMLGEVLRATQQQRDLACSTASTMPLGITPSYVLRALATALVRRPSIDWARGWAGLAGVVGALVPLLVSLGLGVVVLGMFLPCGMCTHCGGRAQGQLTSCESNEKNTGTAMEMYSTDNEGRYPPTMGPLTPNYLKIIPTCPAAGTDTYSATYQMTMKPDGYSFYCAGIYHSAILSLSNFPQYNSVQGLITGH